MPCGNDVSALMKIRKFDSKKNHIPMSYA